MNDLNFNIYAFTNPRTKAEYLSLAREAVREMTDILDLIKAREQELEAYCASEHTPH